MKSRQLSICNAKGKCFFDLMADPLFFILNPKFLFSCKISDSR